MSNRRPCCANCGKLAALSTDTQVQRKEAWDQMPEFEPYSGNLIVTRQTIRRFNEQYGGGHVKHSAILTRWLWDGESYSPFYDGLWCTLRCAREYATRIYKAAHG